MPIGAGVFKKLALKRQSGLGVIAPAGAAGSAQYLRRTSSTLDLAKATYASSEIRSDQQVVDLRHGVRSVPGTISGELSVGTYQLPFESVLRGRAVGAITSGALSTIAIASSGAGTYTGTLTRGSGSFITDGFRVGMIVRMTGAGATNNTNMLITALTALVMTVRTLNQTDFTTAAAGPAITVQIAGKRVAVPNANHYRDYYTVEHWHADLSISERFRDVVFNGMTVTLPQSGMATVEFPVMGLDALSGSVEYFTTPASESSGAQVASSNGAIIVGGTVLADVTGLTISAAGNYAAPGGVVGSNVDPDIIPGILGVTGQLTVLFRDATLRDAFWNETEFAIHAALTGDNTAAAGAIAFSMPRCKATGNTKNDSQQSLSQTVPFQALRNVGAAAGTEDTTLAIQDTAFV